LPLVLALFLSSCLQHRVVIRLEKDGSGTLTEETTFGAQALAMIEQMATLGGEEAGDPVGDLADEASAKERLESLGEGVTLEKVEKIDEAGRKGGRVVYAFEDINKLNFTFGESMNEMSDDMPQAPGAEEPEEEKPLDFHYEDGVLTLKNPQADKEQGEAEPAQPMDDQQMAMAQQMMGDMVMSLKLEIPGGIAETNASHVDGDTITFLEMEMGKLLADPEKFRKFAAANPQTPAEMQEAARGIEGVKVETEDEVRVELK